MELDIKKILIILAISIIVIGGGYFAWKYIYNKPEVKYIKTSQENEELKENMENREIKKMTSLQPVNYEDTNLYPYFDITIGDDYIGRIIYQLFDEEVPLTCKNFRYLCSNNLFNKDDSKPAYQDTQIHRVIKDFMIQGGDITRGDGTGGYSIYGEKFNDENFNLTHNQPGMLSMANAGENTNNSQFFITLKKTPWLDGKHVVFGIITEGFDIIKKIEELETSDSDKPIKPVIISKCGLMKSEKK